MAEKKIFELTDKEMIALIKEGEVRHRLCDVCGCELSVPDAGVFSREGFTTVNNPALKNRACKVD